MSVIENFNVLSETELEQFAVKLLEKINSESIFISDTKFELSFVETSDLTGNLYIGVEYAKFIDVPRDASWQVGDEDEAYSPDLSYVDYYDTISEDAKKVFKTLSTVIDGYKVSVEIDDVYAEDVVDIDVDTTSHEDGGIGHYEYWGEFGYDSRPYVEVEGTITAACNIMFSFVVEPETTAPESVIDDETEEN